MGCWGIKALESDEGLDIIIELEKILPKDGHLQLEKLSGGSKCGPSAFAAATGISVCDADREESIRGSV